MVIVSDANTVFIDYILQAQGLQVQHDTSVRSVLWSVAVIRLSGSPSLLALSCCLTLRPSLALLQSVTHHVLILYAA